MKKLICGWLAFFVTMEMFGLELNPSFDPKMVAKYKEYADAGDVEAQYLYSFALANGMGIAMNKPKAMVYAQKAAAQGFGLAFYRVAVGYEQGWGVSSNGVDAAKWYGKFVQWAKPKAEQGDVHAQCDLGVCYEYGDGVEKNKEEAARWYRKAAEQGNARAQCNLGVCYVNGNGVEKNREEAVRWYCKAAEQGYACAQCNLGACYANGNGVDKNQGEAVRWYRNAAEQGYARAQFYLGWRYCEGRGVEQNFAEAARWHRKAAEQGRGKGLIYFGLDSVNGIEWAYTVKDGFATISARPPGESPSTSASIADTSASISEETTGEIEVPSMLGGCPVSCVGRGAFEDCKGLTSILIPEGVTEIEDFAFSFCSGLRKVHISQGVKRIGNSAFCCCRDLVDVNIPNGVTSIGEDTFDNCDHLIRIDLPVSVTNIGDGAFSCCKNLTYVNIPEGVTHIGEGAFRYCHKLESVTVPKSVVSMGIDAFVGCDRMAGLVGMRLIKDYEGKPHGYTTAQLIRIYRMLEGQKVAFENGVLKGVKDWDVDGKVVVADVSFKDTTHVNPQRPEFLVQLKVSNPLLVEGLRRCNPGIGVKSLSGKVGRLSKFALEATLSNLEMVDGDIVFDERAPDVKFDFDVERLSNEEILLKLAGDMSEAKKKDLVKALAGRKVTFLNGVFAQAMWGCPNDCGSNEVVLDVLVEFEMPTGDYPVIGKISNKAMQEFVLGLDMETKIESMTGVVDEEGAKYGVFNLRNVSIKVKK